MTGEVYRQLVPAVCASLGGGERFAEVLLANETVLTESWNVTGIELKECAQRLVAGGRVPSWPNELTNALHRELIEVRLRAREAASRVPGVASVCDLCENRGMVTVPHLRCVWGGRVVPYFNPVTKMRYRRAISTSVICDCPTGGAIQNVEQRNGGKKTLTLAEYQRRIEHADGVALWREYERSQAEDARRFSPRGNSELFDRVMRKILEEGT